MEKWISAGLAATILLSSSACSFGRGNTVKMQINGVGGIKNEYYYVGVYNQNGGINRIQNMKDKNLVNYAVGYDEFTGREVGTKWLGDVDFAYCFEDGTWNEVSTDYSGDSRKVVKWGETELRVTYDGNSDDKRGIRDFTLAESYRLDGKELIWKVTVKNTLQSDMKFGKIGFPLMFNSPLNGTVTEFYEQTTYAHSCIAYNGSFLCQS